MSTLKYCNLDSMLMGTTHPSTKQTGCYVSNHQSQDVDGDISTAHP